MQNLFWIVLLSIAGIIILLIAIYNSLIRAKNQTAEAFSDIDVQLKRRYDLIPNLINTVKGYAQHEQGLFEAVTKARSQAMNAQNLTDKAQAENALSQTLKSLFAVSENYPDLKASQNFLQLQDELADTENKIQAARRFYNGNVRDFNTKIQIFPNNLFVAFLKFKAFEFFGAEEVERKNVEVKF